MKLFTRILAAWQALTKPPANRYEAGVAWSPNRSWLPAAVQDARLDASAAPRTEIMRKARYFEKNSAVAQRLASVFCDYVVGPNGLLVTPASSNPQWNSAAKIYWNTNGQFIDLNSRQNFGTLQGLMAWRWFFDGEIFLLKTRGQNRSGQWFPRIQLVESHRVGTPPELASEEGKTVCDGVAIDENGRPTGYWMRADFDGKNFRPIQAQNVIHLFEPSRPCEYRGLSLLHAVLNDLHLLDDLEQLEHRAAIDAAEKSTFVNTATGAMPPSLLGGGVPLSGLPTPVNGLTYDDAKRTAELQDTIGGKSFALKIGEDVKQFMPNRPTEATRYLWEYLISKVCIGVGIPKLLVIPYSMQGTVVRGDYDVANAYFQSRSSIMAASAREVYLYCLGWGIQREPALNDPLPPDWFNVTIRPPRSVNVDVGRNSAAEKEELRDGRTNFEIIYSAFGLDWQEELEKKAQQSAYIKALAAKYDIDAASISTAVADLPERFQTEDPNAGLADEENRRQLEDAEV